jgi:cupin 2 domain-containing protein
VNIFELPALPADQELTTVLAEKGGVRIERVISTGQTTGWYDQTETEFVVLLEGEATIELENGGPVNLSKGDTLLLRPHERHRVSRTTCDPPCVWICIFY